MVEYISYIAFRTTYRFVMVLMHSHPTDNPHLLSAHEVGNAPQSEEEPFHPEIPYTLPHEEVNQFRRITRAYA
jgi:hypothetical protein